MLDAHAQPARPRAGADDPAGRARPGDDEMTDDRIARFEERRAALAKLSDDELVEVTPKSIRLRKKMLNENDRKRYERSKV